MEDFTPPYPSDRYNDLLVHNVHPPQWVNPQPLPRYDLVVIGAGTAGLVTAAGAAGVGARVALVERDLMGGDCLNVGCVPSKSLTRAARAVHDVRMSSGFGVVGGAGGGADFGAVMERMRRIRAGVSAHDSAQRFRDELGVDVFIGHGRFIAPDGIAAGEAVLRFHKAAACTGARAAAPPIPGLAEAGYLTNETVFNLTELPPRLAVLGGGPIGCELAQCFARFGSRVTLIERGAHILPREDADAAAVLQHQFRSEGIDVLLHTAVHGVSRRGNERIVLVEQEGERREVTVDSILVGLGRAPNVEGLDLEKAAIDYDHSGINVTDTLRTSNRRVFAAGDVCSPYKFTHAADAHARIVIANALFPSRQRASALTIPWCTYADPEIAHVGMHEREARERGADVVTYTVSLADVDRAVIDGQSDGFARVHLKKRDGRILGATIVARHAGEMIGEVTLAMTNGLGISAIGRTIHPYPTQAEVLKKVADAHNRSRLTPGVRKAIGIWLKLWRSGR